MKFTASENDTNDSYHHQCIANRTAVIMLQVLIGHSGEKLCKK